MASSTTPAITSTSRRTNVCFEWVQNVWLIFKWTELMKPSNYLVIYWHEISTRNRHFFYCPYRRSCVIFISCGTLIALHINWLRHNFDHNRESFERKSKIIYGFCSVCSAFVIMVILIINNSNNNFVMKIAVNYCDAPWCHFVAIHFFHLHQFISCCNFLYRLPKCIECIHCQI